jgi:hypothetical protein
MRHKRILLSQLALDRSFDVFNLCVEGCVNGLMMQSNTATLGSRNSSVDTALGVKLYDVDECVEMLLAKRTLLAGHFQFSMRHQVNSFFQQRTGRLGKTQVERDANRLTISAERLSELERRMSRMCHEELRQLQGQLISNQVNVFGRKTVDPLSPRFFCRALRDSLTYGFERKEQTLEAFMVMRVPFCLVMRQEYGAFLESLAAI